MANNKVIFGNTVLADLTRVTATADKVFYGTTFHNSAGVVNVGSYRDLSGASVTGENLTITNSFVVPTWSSGSDADIATALDLHYRNIINLHDYWHIGDERVVNLSAMSAMSPLDDTHDSQDVTFVLTEIGGKTLTTPINNKTECVFQVDSKSVLATRGRMHSTRTDAITWNTCDRRTWCNTVLKSALPQTFGNIFKEFINQSATASEIENTNDYFAMRAEIEITGTNAQTLAGEGELISYYNNGNNRVKINGEYFCRGKGASSSKTFSSISSSGTGSYNFMNDNHYLAFFGVI